MDWQKSTKEKFSRWLHLGHLEKMLQMFFFVILKQTEKCIVYIIPNN